MTIYIEKKKKVRVKSTTIKEQLMLFVNSVIENPSFDSQTKECLNTPQSKFGSKCVVSDKFIEKLAKMGVMDAALSLNEIKQNKAAKKTDGKRVEIFVVFLSLWMLIGRVVQSQLNVVSFYVREIQQRQELFQVLVRKIEMHLEFIHSRVS